MSFLLERTRLQRKLWEVTPGGRGWPTSAARVGSEGARNNIPVLLLWTDVAASSRLQKKKRKYNSTLICLTRVSKNRLWGKLFQSCRGCWKQWNWRLMWSLATWDLRNVAVRRERGWAGVRGRPEAKNQVTKMEAMGGGQLFKKRISQVAKGSWWTLWGGGVREEKTELAAPCPLPGFGLFSGYTETCCFKEM